MTPEADGFETGKLDLLAGLLNTVDLSSTAQNRFAVVEAWLASELGVPDAKVRATYVSEPKMVSPRLSTPGIVRARPELVLAAIGDGTNLDITKAAIERKMQKDGHLLTVLVAQKSAPSTWSFPAVFSRPGTGLVDRLCATFPEAILTSVADPDSSLGGSATGAASPGRSGGPSSGARSAVVIDPGVLRMVRHSLATSKAVVLVGPPGTGKTTLLEQALKDLAADHKRYGLSRAPEWGDPVTPDESWSAGDVVGGPTVIGGEIRFRPGHVLRAIMDDRILILDEANRADLDKILGALLTWMSSRETIVGRLTEDSGSPLVTIGWNSSPRSVVVNANLIADPLAKPADGPGPVRFLAGQEWRLVATYNAVDAQRVFRFGEALGRRFAKIPVPPPDLLTAAELITNRCTALDIDTSVAERIIGLYEAHLSAEETVLGLAPFLDLSRYLRSVDAAGDLHLDDPADADTAVAESYLTQVGLSLARLEEDELDRIGDRIVNGGVISASSWSWVRNLLPALRG